MADHKFIAQNKDVNILVKLHNYVASLFGRKDVLKDFCVKSGIDYKPIKNKKYNLPSTQYVIEHDELTYLGDIRDKSILALYEKYVDCQLETEKECRAIKNNCKIQEEIVQSAKDEKQRLENKKKSATKPIMKVKLADSIGVIKTKIINETRDLTELENQYDAEATILETNRKNWLKQLEIIDTLFQLRKERFDKSISKKIRKHLGFTNCHSYLPDYNDSVKATLKGEYHEKEK